MREWLISNLVMIHPFRDGNGRMARCLRTLVLARAGILAPVFSSVEEYLRRNTRALLDRVDAGEAITVDGRPVAVLEPVTRRQRWLTKNEFLRSVVSRQADSALRAELRALSPDTTDDL